MARKFNAGYYFSEGFHSIFTHGFMSFAAVCMIVACLLIMGSFSLLAVNLDHMLGDLEAENEFLAYVDENLTDEDLDWFASMPIFMRAELPGCEPFVICHGSPERSNYLFHADTPEAEQMISRLDEFGSRLMLCGHSHIPFVIRRGDRLLVNPSVSPRSPQRRKPPRSSTPGGSHSAANVRSS